MVAQITAENAGILFWDTVYTVYRYFWVYYHYVTLFLLFFCECESKYSIVYAAVYLLNYTDSMHFVLSQLV